MLVFQIFLALASTAAALPLDINGSHAPTLQELPAPVFTNLSPRSPTPAYGTPPEESIIIPAHLPQLPVPTVPDNVSLHTLAPVTILLSPTEPPRSPAPTLQTGTFLPPNQPVTSPVSSISASETSFQGFTSPIALDLSAPAPPRTPSPVYGTPEEIASFSSDQQQTSNSPPRTPAPVYGIPLHESSVSFTTKSIEGGELLSESLVPLSPGVSEVVLPPGTKVNLRDTLGQYSHG